MKKIALALVLMAGIAAPARAQVTRTIVIGPNSGYLGIRFGESTTITSSNGSQSNDSKVVIADVMKDSPAEKAGLKDGDEILKVNGLAATNGKFAALAQRLEPGDTVKLRIKRGSTEKDYTVVAAKRPNDLFTYSFSTDSVRGLYRRFMDSARIRLDSLNLPDITIMRGDSTFDLRIAPFRGVWRDSLFFKGGNDSTIARLFRERSGDRFPLIPNEIWRLDDHDGPGMIFRSVEVGTRSIGGAELTEVDPAMIDILKTDKGLLVLRVAPETPADRAGLQPGDVIIKAKARDVRDVSDLRSIVRANPDGVKLDVLRKGVTRTIELKTRGR